MQLSATNSIYLGLTYRAGPEHYSTSPFIKAGFGVLDFSLRLTLYTIAFHRLPPRMIIILMLRRVFSCYVSTAQEIVYNNFPLVQFVFEPKFRIYYVKDYFYAP
jgi:hypothetical protein